MKLFVVVTLCALLGVICAEKYTTKYDNVDLEEILQNERLLNNYINCLLDEGPCTADGTELKQSLPDALMNECSKCSKKQNEGSRIVIRHLIKNKRPVWDKLEAKYDPEHIYRQKYDAELKKEGIVL